MNEQERSMIEGLFQRLQQAETQSGPRDQEAEALIQNLMARQPSAPYLLAQVVLVQEQGLRNLQTRVEELERQQAERAQDGGGFLGGLFGGGQPQPPSQPATPKTGGWSNSRLPTRGSTAALQQPGIQPGAQRGGFMAGAMQTALGVGGGMLLANAVSGLFADEAEAAEPAATAAPEEPDESTSEDEGGFFDDFFGGGEDDEY
jgi:hypothetical protein